MDAYAHDLYSRMTSPPWALENTRIRYGHDHLSSLFVTSLLISKARHEGGKKQGAPSNHQIPVTQTIQNETNLERLSFIDSKHLARSITCALLGISALDPKRPPAHHVIPHPFHYPCPAQENAPRHRGLDDNTVAMPLAKRRSMKQMQVGVTVLMIVV